MLQDDLSHMINFFNIGLLLNSQLAFTYSKSTIETIDKGVKYVQS